MIFGRNKTYFGDAWEVMNTFPDKCVDHIVCDLPFYDVVDEDWDKQWASPEEYLDWVRDLINQYDRILKDNGNVFLFTGRQLNRQIAIILDEFFMEKRIIIWCRKRNFNNTRGKALASGYEPICYYTKGDGIFNNIKIKTDSKRKEYTEGTLKDGITLSDVWSDIPALPHNSKEKLKHPTQKPFALIERIVNMGTNEGDLILDSCAGSGTLGRVCRKTKRDFIMIENVKKYHEIIINN